MSRPRKARTVCQMPIITEFSPLGRTDDFVILTVEEYEAIRWIDKEKCTQEECSIRMEVSRPTVQFIYDSARSKLANALVSGIGIRIEGGDYAICDGNKTHCFCDNCCKRQKQ